MAAGGAFTDAERRFFEEHAARLYVSAVSIWEMRLKFHARHASGARKSHFAPEDVIAAFEQQDVTFLPMTMTQAAKRLDVPIAHRDPFDELLLVQAQEASRLHLKVCGTVVTSDQLDLADLGRTVGLFPRRPRYDTIRMSWTSSSAESRS